MNLFFYVADAPNKLARVLGPDKHFQPSLIFAIKAASLLEWGTLRFPILRVGLGLTRKYQTRLEMLARYKHSSLFCLSIEDEEKKVFYNLDTRTIFLSLRPPEGLPGME